jgi:predicted RNase H-like HicB family nuclease
MKKQTSDVMREYPSNVFWSDEDEGFVATAPDLPGCSAFGATQVQALAELHHAIDAWIEAATAAGNPVPQPSRPLVEPARAKR